MSLPINKNGYWETNNNSGHIYDDKLCIYIYKFLQNNQINSLLDLGCGTAQYCDYFLKQNILCDAYDGNPNTPNISNGIGKVLDFSSSFKLDKTYDCVMSLEVGEHIPKKYENIFIDNICKHSNRWILLSWAIIGQSGNGHVNCQNNDYIIQKIKAYNFYYKESESQYLRNNSTAPWFKNTIMVFEKNRSN